jgi:spore coat protein CotH
MNSLFNRSFKVLFLFILLTGYSCSSDDGYSTIPDEKPDIKPEDKLPVVTINTNGGVIVDEPKIKAKMDIFIVHTPEYQGNIGIEIRGASSQMFPKKSYGLETRDANDEDLEVSIFGFPEEEDWILYAPYSDKSLMRNFLIYDLSRDMDRYASRCKFVDLEINGEYKGVYVFMEKLKRDKVRIDINKLKKDENSGEDLTGGYILKIDKISGNNLGDGYNEQNSFTSKYKPLHSSNGQEIRYLYDYPKAEKITTQQKDYIKEYVNNFEDALASDDFTDPEKGYRAYIDVDSFIDFFLLNEVSHNVDGFRLSTYMHKDKNGKLKMGPIWDFNLAFGNANYCGGGDTDSWAYQFNSRCPNDFWAVPFWWERFLQDPEFVSRLKARWAELRGNVLSDASILNKIDDYETLLNKSGSVEENFKVWQILGVYVWPNNYVGKTYQEELNYLQEWIKSRLTWMDRAVNNL